MYTHAYIYIKSDDDNYGLVRGAVLKQHQLPIPLISKHISGSGTEVDHFRFPFGPHGPVAPRGPAARVPGPP